jgi:5-formyltetrahydrofolate cyclo-ligase
MDKPTLRRWLRAKRLSLSAREAAAMGARAGARLGALEDFRRARRVVLYSPIAGEAQTQAIFLAARAEGKECYLPRVGGPRGTLDFLRVDDLDRLARGAFGVPEPRAGAPLCGPVGRETVVVVPGLAFDRQGFRLGWGGGYYDRALSGVLRNAVKVGLAYEFQFLPVIPRTAEDQRVDYVATEERLWLCSVGSGSLRGERVPTR